MVHGEGFWEKSCYEFWVGFALCSTSNARSCVLGSLGVAVVREFFSFCSSFFCGLSFDNCYRFPQFFVLFAVRNQQPIDRWSGDLLTARAAVRCVCCHENDHCRDDIIRQRHWQTAWRNKIIHQMPSIIDHPSIPWMVMAWWFGGHVDCCCQRTDNNDNNY